MTKNIIQPLSGIASAANHSKSAELFRLIKNRIELWRSTDGETYARIGRCKNLRIRSREFESWLRREAFILLEASLSDNALKNVQGLLEAKIAASEEPAYVAYNRVGKDDGSIYIDLCQEPQAFVKVTAEGWEVVSETPARFIQPVAMRPLPIPVSGGSLVDLGSIFNLSSDADLILLAGALVSYLNPEGPYPILAFQGPQGSSKSTATRMVRRLLDPHDPLTGNLPTNDRDLAAAAKSNWLMAFDNVSSIRAAMSDSLCRLATGSGFKARRLYSDYDEVGFTASRPIVINGIGPIINRADLADRSIIFDLHRIEASERQTEKEVNAAFEEAHPRLLGFLLDGVVSALRYQDQVILDNLPRMADLAVLATAAESGLGIENGAFLTALNEKRKSQMQDAASQEPLIDLLEALVPEVESIELTPTQMLKKLRTKTAGFSVPELKSAQAMSRKLSRLEPLLRERGIEFERDRGTANRLIRLRRLPPESDV